MAGLTEFYTIRLRYPFNEDGQQVTMHIQVHTLEQDPGQGGQDPRQHVLVYPQKIQFTKRKVEATITVQVQGETPQELLHDRQFQLRHLTSSRNYDFHKLVLPLNIYRLGHTYIDIACAGQDDFLQLGTEEGLLQVTQRSKRQTDSPSGTTQSSAHDPKAASPGGRSSRLSHPKNKFDSLSTKYNQEQLVELEHQKQRLMNKAKTLDPNGPASGAAN